MSGRKHKPIAIAILISMIVGLSMAHAAWAQDKKPRVSANAGRGKLQRG
jgi:hypothetical protein